MKIEHLLDVRNYKRIRIPPNWKIIKVNIECYHHEHQWQLDSDVSCSWLAYWSCSGAVHSTLLRLRHVVPVGHVVVGHGLETPLKLIPAVLQWIEVGGQCGPFHVTQSDLLDTSSHDISTVRGRVVIHKDAIWCVLTMLWNINWIYDIGQSQSHLW